MSTRITKVFGINIPEQYQSAVELARAYAIGANASRDRKSTKDYLKEFMELEIKDIFNSEEIPHYQAFREGFGGKRIILTDEAMESLRKADISARYNISPLFTGKKTSREVKTQLINNLQNSYGELPVDVEKIPNAWEDKELIFCTYADGAKSLFSRFNKGTTLHLELSDDSDIMKEHGRDGIFYEAVLGTVGARDPVGDLPSFGHVFNLNSVDTYHRLASLKRPFTFIDYLQSVSERKIVRTQRIEGKEYNEYEDRVYIRKLTGLNSASKIFSTSFNEERGPFVPINKAAAMIANLSVRKCDGLESAVNY